MKEPARNQMPPTVLRAKPPVLKSESATEYISLHAQLVQEVEPKGPIEEIYVEEMAALIGRSAGCAIARSTPSTKPWRAWLRVRAALIL
jgi:hypothetical protein